MVSKQPHKLSRAKTRASIFDDYAMTPGVARVWSKDRQARFQGIRS
jgi:hypothetical protein